MSRDKDWVKDRAVDLMEYRKDDPIRDRQEEGCVEVRVGDRVEEVENRVENWAEKAIMEDRAKMAEDNASSFRLEAQVEARRREEDEQKTKNWKAASGEDNVNSRRG